MSGWMVVVWVGVKLTGWMRGRKVGVALETGRAGGSGRPSGCIEWVEVCWMSGWKPG